MEVISHIKCLLTKITAIVSGAHAIQCQSIIIGKTVSIIL